MILLGFIMLVWWTINTNQALKEVSTAPAEKLPPDHIKPAGMTRKQLEKAACDCLYLTGAKFDIYTYCMNSTDYELMTIIKDFNIYNA